ncbi:TraM recognition domain-containing protein [Ekhidna sp.]|jgi:hypothetical protein|uniref:type IV secretory system conjugative DNA transfer family protein n=1 Tax=Ekhidna sp. TaxID=2608089 RepID=UPI0032EEAE57
MVHLDEPILNIEGNPWTVRNACEGVQIFGGIGSGKTSGSGQTLALKYLQAGYGGLVLTVKTDECDRWKEYCKEAGREDDLCIIEPDGDYTFNFLDYEVNREGQGGGQTENLVMVMKTVIKANSLGQSKSNNEEFWDDALDMLLISLIDLCTEGKSKLTIDDINDIARSLPKSPEDRNRKSFRSTRFYEFFHYVEKLFADDDNYTEPHRMRIFKSLEYYFFSTLAELSDKTRTIIEQMLWGFLFRLSREPVYTLFCNNSPNIVPEDSIDGKIILLNLPTKVYDKVGKDAQILFKYIWQRAMERRNVKEDGGEPVFLWADEAQNFIHEHDFSYQATARSSRVCTVYLTQNINNYLASLGGDKGEHQVKSFMGTMATKIFHSNADIETNMYASKMFGQVYKPFPTKTKAMGKEFSVSESYSWNKDADVPPELFTGLKTGGPKNNFEVEAFIHRQGTPWEVNGTKENYIKTFFKQGTDYSQ